MAEPVKMLSGQHFEPYIFELLPKQIIRSHFYFKYALSTIVLTLKLIIWYNALIVYIMFLHCTYICKNTYIVYICN